MLQAYTGDPAYMNNIDFLLRGYNIMKGNPKALGRPDPGWRQSIFAGTYNNGDDNKTTDNRYWVPDGTSIQPYEACRLSFETTEISGNKSYSDSLNVKVGVKAGYDAVTWSASFSASTDYKEVTSGSSSDYRLYTQSEAECSLYIAQLQTSNMPNLTTNFNNAVAALPTEYDAAEYHAFIDAFGTHYVNEVRMGASFGQQSELTKEAWSKALQEGTSIEVEAEAAAYGATLAAETATDENKERVEDFSKRRESSGVYSVGSAPPRDGQALTWANQVIKENPAPMSMQLVQIDEALVGISAGISTKRENVRKALGSYCEALKIQGYVASCDAPGSDNPFPNPPAPTPTPTVPPTDSKYWDGMCSACPASLWDHCWKGGHLVGERACGFLGCEGLCEF
jgi:hypothetical protein